VTRRWLPPALLAAYAVAFGGRALGGDLLVFDDHPGQLYRLAHAITLGLAPWRFNPGWWAGYAELQFYPPGFAWLGAVLHLGAGGALDLGAVYRILLWLAWLLPGAATYLLLRRALGDPWLALPGALVALTLSAGSRSGVEEGLRWGLVGARLGWGVLPLLAWSLLRWAERGGRPPLGAAPLVAAVLLLHPSHAPAAAALVVLAARRQEPRLRRLGVAAAILALALGLAAVWLLPLLAHLRMALPLAWADASPVTLLGRLASQPIVLALAALGVAAWWRRARQPAAAGWLLGLAPAMAVVVAVDALVLQPAGLAWLPADRVMDGLYFGLVLAGALGFAAWVAPLGRPAVAALAAVLLCLPLAWGPDEPGLTLWPRAREWPGEREVVRGLRMDALWDAVRQAPPGRVLFLRSGVPLDWRPEWWRPHTHITALTPLRSGRPIMGGTFTHPSPVAGFVYTRSAAPRPLTLLAEQRDGQTLFGHPIESLAAATFNPPARRLGIGLIVALEADAARLPFLTDNQAVTLISRIGPFRLFTLAGPAPEPESTGPQRWRVTLPTPATGWVPISMAYSPLWLARAGDHVLQTRRDDLGLLEVALPGPATAIDLEHRPGPAEWAGLALSVVSAVAFALWVLRARRSKA
jgi:hypothetical protein